MSHKNEQVRLGRAVWRRPSGDTYRVVVTGWHETAGQRFAEIREETAFAVHGDQLDFTTDAKGWMRAGRWDSRRAGSGA
jgi:hypothetical protein